jgi:CBS-domain-containing membrane protein
MTRRTVGDVMTAQVAAVRTATPFKEVVRILADWRVSAVPVLDENDRIAGVVSEADLLPKEEYPAAAGAPLLVRRRERVARAKATGGTAGQLMTAPAITARPDMTVGQAATVMERHGVKRLPVVDDEGALIGIVSRRDLLKVFLRTDDEIREEIIRDVFMRVLWADPTRFDVEVREGVATLSGHLELRSHIPIAVRLTRVIDGVVDVIDKLTFETDDAAAPRRAGRPIRSR